MEVGDAFNQLYHNNKHNITLYLAWYGRGKISNLRAYKLPFSGSHGQGGAKSGNSVVDMNRQCFHPHENEVANVTHLKPCTAALYTANVNTSMLLGTIIQNITGEFRPHLLFVNWGHHSTYYYKAPKGKWQYDSILSSFKEMTRLGYKRSTQFIWKETTPLCSVLTRNNETFFAEQCTLNYREEGPDDQKELLGYHLVALDLLQLYDTALLVSRIHRELGRRNASEYLSWDGMHLNCWVNSQLNRALVAQFFPPMPHTPVPGNLTATR